MNSSWDSLRNKRQRSWRDEPASAGQMKMIDYIAHWTGQSFTGKTKGEASDYISMHKDEADENVQLSHSKN